MAKTTDWRPGPTVCRCCLSEGCYKDISTEYFWMGKREVYQEMLSETFTLSIAYSQSNGPNSHSRLICEPCISRLRDASEFKRQVLECEKTFMSYLDPGSSVAETTDSEVPAEPMETEVKVERVKEEKPVSDDDFDDRGADFHEDQDDDDDDMDDQPLTRLASKVPKKESVDIMELLDTSKPGSKRKSSSKAKTAAVKKTKSKKEAKATCSKAPKPEKKKKGEDVTKSETNTKSWIVVEVKKERDDNSVLSPHEAKALARLSTVNIISNSNSYPFKWWKNSYMCFYCDDKFLDFSSLEQHNLIEHNVNETEVLKGLTRLRRYQRVKVNFLNFSCKLCEYNAENFVQLKEHLKSNHNKKLDLKNDGVFPYRIIGDLHMCVVCNENFHNFDSLNKHMNDHFRDYFCHQCGLGYATKGRLRGHYMTHVNGCYNCETCGKTFKTEATKRDHIQRVHMQIKKHKCPHCAEMFTGYRHRQNHIMEVHGVQGPEFRCGWCAKVFSFNGLLKLHVRRVHFKAREHVCHICKKHWANSSLLRNHMISHSGEKNFECQICKKKYGLKKTLIEHMRIHNNDRRFPCAFCDKAFIQKCSLQSHIKTHHREEMMTSE